MISNRCSITKKKMMMMMHRVFRKATGQHLKKFLLHINTIQYYTTAAALLYINLN